MFELLTADEMASVDAQAVALGCDAYALMQAAGCEVASVIRQRFSTDSNVVVVAGPGNNGGDGAIAAQILSEEGYSVCVVRVAVAASKAAEAQRAFNTWQGHTLPVAPESPVSADIQLHISAADVIIDALFGAGLSRKISGVYETLIAHINSSRAWVLAVDLPSGIDGNRHCQRGPAVKADHTITFFRYKPAHFLYPARTACAQLELAQIGIPESVLDAVQPSCMLNSPLLWQRYLPLLSVSGHKYQRGHLVVRSGALTQTGAARLSAEAALQTTAGLVTVASPADSLAINAAHLTAVMLRQCEDENSWRDILQDKRITAAVLGPANGVSDLTRRCVESTLELGVACVLDADALSSFASCADELMGHTQRASGPVVLTPHHGEFFRLFNTSVFATLSSKLHQARLAAKQSQAVVVFKGPDTVIASPDGRARINSNGPPWLATAGSGDVLAGLIGGFLANDMHPFDAASAAVWVHADAASRHGYPMSAEQLITYLGQSLASIATVAVDPIPLGLARRT